MINILAYISSCTSEFDYKFLVYNTLLGVHFWVKMCVCLGFSGGSVGKESACNVGDTGDVGSIPGLVRSPRGRHGNPLQYSCLENPIDREGWQGIVHRVA